MVTYDPLRVDLAQACDWMTSGWLVGVFDDELIAAKAAELVDEAVRRLEKLLPEALHDGVREAHIARLAVAMAIEELYGEEIVLGWLPEDVILSIVFEARHRVTYTVTR